MKDTENCIKNRILGLVNYKRLGNEEKPNQKIERAARDMEGNQVSMCPGSQMKTFFFSRGRE